MGDVLSLVEMAEKTIKADDAEAMMKKMMDNKFDFDDFLKQFKMVSGMGGGMTSVMKMLPGPSAFVSEQAPILIILILQSSGSAPSIYVLTA